MENNSIGAEVGQKMRAAIKAKLLELNCYVDDELPDYIMVMVANRRSKSQMKDDLELFLTTKTTDFVDWLHIVLKKLKQVTVTNLDLYKNKQQSKSKESNNVEQSVDSNVKTELNLKKTKPSSTSGTQLKMETSTVDNNDFKSLTDDLPMTATKLSEQRRIIYMKDNRAVPQIDNFDIPLLSEVNMSTEDELESIERKIKTVKSRLGLIVNDQNPQEIHENRENNNYTPPPRPKSTHNHNVINNNKEQVIDQDFNVKKSRTLITFESGKRNPEKSLSIRERLGSKRQSTEIDEYGKRIRTNDNCADEDNSNADVKNISVGVKSKVSIPAKQQLTIRTTVRNENLEGVKSSQRSVPSAIKIKPRVIPSDTPQANKNLLLKAVAEAQRSVAQTPTVGTNKTENLYRQDAESKKSKSNGILNRLGRRPTTTEHSNQNTEQMIKKEAGEEKSIKSRLDKRKTPSPIVFDGSDGMDFARINDDMTFVNNNNSNFTYKKTRERCKYWPNCRHGDQCDFIHPTVNCDRFPNCSYGDQCLFIHPYCKFGPSCTRPDCIYSHLQQPKGNAKSSQTVCKYFRNCVNNQCQFYHPRPCRFGAFCRNPETCNFSGHHTTLYPASQDFNASTSNHNFFQ